MELGTFRNINYYSGNKIERRLIKDRQEIELTTSLKYQSFQSYLIYINL
jgi:hypothetical protein